MKMLRMVLGAALLLAAVGNGYSQDKNIPKEYYQAATIPDSLKTDADAVVRYEMQEVKVKDVNKETLKYHVIVTVLNEKGDDQAREVLGYNKKYNIYNDFEMRIYNATGALIKKYNKSDMYDRSASDEITLSDERRLFIKHDISSYPTTVEISYEATISNFIYPGGWYFQTDPKVAVQKSVCKVLINPALGFRYKAKNTSIVPQKSIQDNLDTYTWQAQNIKACKPEDDALPWQVTKCVVFATNVFEFYGIPGNFDTWQNYGKWQSGLNADVCSLSPQRVEEIKKMTDTIKNDKDKARFLYHYMQQNVRYVSIQLGLGGLKPFPATFVDQKKYGDCKALSNYMGALLKAVNISSYYAIVNSGANAEPADLNFPFDSFNHIILCVPFKNDTTWLECTSSTQLFGKLGTFTENRKALIVTEEGGKLVNTPKSTIEDNTFSSYTHVTLNPDGSAKAQIRLETTGVYRDMYLEMQSAKLDEQKEFMIRYLNMKQPLTFNFRDTPDKDGTKEINVDLEYDRFFDMAVGNKQFYKPSVFDLWGMTLPELKQRKTDFYFESPMQKSNVTTIDLPAGFEMETLPANVKLKFTYGDFEADYRYDQSKNQVIGTVKFNLYNQMIPAAKYAELQQYMDAIAKAQNKKLVIKRKA